MFDVFYLSQIELIPKFAATLKELLRINSIWGHDLFRNPVSYIFMIPIHYFMDTLGILVHLHH